MPPIGKITAKQNGTSLILTDESGQSFSIEGYGAGKGVLNDLDPRIDLTKPIYEQAAKLHEKDIISRRKRTTKAA